MTDEELLKIVGKEVKQIKTEVLRAEKHKRMVSPFGVLLEL